MREDETLERLRKDLDHDVGKRKSKENPFRKKVMKVEAYMDLVGHFLAGMIEKCRLGGSYLMLIEE